MSLCPECTRLLVGTVCVCGWIATPVAPAYGVSPEPASCATCAAIWEKRKEYRPGDTSVPLHHCYGCGTHDHGVSAFLLDTPCVEDRGKRICAGCRIPMLKRRSTCTHAWAAGKRDGEKCDRCALEIQGLRELGRAYMAKVAERSVTL